jgi:hypothetical protein
MNTEDFSNIAILVFTVPFIFTALVVWLELNAKRHSARLKADLYLKALEKGQPLPVDFQIEKKESPLQKGLILTLVGIGISIMLWIIFDDPESKRLAVVGIIPLFMGIAFLIIHFVEKGKAQKNNAK